MFCLALLGLTLAHGDEPEFTSTAWRADAGPVHVWWAPDALLLGGGIGTYFLLRDKGADNAGGVSEPRGLDAIGQPTWSPEASAASDFFGHALKYHGLNMPMLSIAGGAVFGAVRHGGHRLGPSLGAGGAYFLVSAEALSVNLAVTEVLKVGVGRPRPYTSAAFQQQYPDVYASDEIQDTLGEEEHYDAFKSWPSGHTSSSAATSFCLATLIWRDLRADGAPPWVAAATYGAATALTATTGALRVKAGWHHTTDVISGGALGALVGTGVALWHTSGAVRPSVATSDEGSPMLTIGGTF